MRHVLLPMLLLVACDEQGEIETTDDDPAVETDTQPDTDPPTPDTDTDGDVDTDPADSDVDTDVDTDPCPSQLVLITPGDGETDVATDVAVNVVFTGDERAVATASLAVAAGGAAVPLDPPAFTGLGRVLTVQPTDALDRDTAYTLTVDWSCGTEVLTFTTTDLGLPVDPADVTGRTYAIDLSTMRITQPVGVGGWLLNLVGAPDGTAAIHVGDVHAVPPTVDLELGLVTSQGGVWDQDPCLATLPAPGADYAGAPGFEATTPLLPLRFGQVSLDLLAASVSGVFAPGGDFLGDLRIAGAFDTAPVSSALLFGPNTMCALIGTLPGSSASCVACPGGGATCLPIVIEDTRAWPTTPFTLTPRTPADVAADPQCAP